MKKNKDISLNNQTVEAFRPPQFFKNIMFEMYCKYCGHEIADDSVFCAKCGRKVQNDTSSLHEDKFIRVQVVDNKRSEWMDATNIQWKKPIGARLLQTVLVAIGLFFLVYGIVWISIVKSNLHEPWSVCDNYILASDYLGIVSVSGSIDFSYFEGGIVLHNYDEAKQTVVHNFMIKMLLICVLPALIIIVLTLRWIIKTTPKKEYKSLLPRDFANKIEYYTWHGFTFRKYVRFIRNDKYGILDAVSRTIIIPASFDLIEWREKNKSFDGVLNGVRKTYHLKHDSNKK